MKQRIGLFFKGVAMGAADIVPGVSGGTIALITGIYEELIESIKNINLSLFQTLFKTGFKDFWKKLNGNFAAQKNSVIENSNGDYVFHFDADEYPHDILLQQVKPILESNNVDLIWVPRVNTVDGITERHIEKWKWRVSEKGWVNYPDYQSRIFKNDTEIRWQSKVHERIHGAQTYAHLPPQEELSLYHPKTIDKQEKQNKFYETL